jgi:hypothetical protein
MGAGQVSCVAFPGAWLRGEVRPSALDKQSQPCESPRQSLQATVFVNVCPWCESQHPGSFAEGIPAIEARANKATAPRCAPGPPVRDVVSTANKVLMHSIIISWLEQTNNA